jgi:hypothetical protein
MTDEELRAIEHTFDADWSDSVSAERERHGRKLLAEVRRLRGLIKATHAKWEEHGGPHAAADVCGSVPRGECICGLYELEEEAMR